MLLLVVGVMVIVVVAIAEEDYDHDLLGHIGRHPGVDDWRILWTGVRRRRRLHQEREKGGSEETEIPKDMQKKKVPTLKLEE